MLQDRILKRSQFLKRLLYFCLYILPVVPAQTSVGDGREKDSGEPIYEPGPEITSPKLVHYVEPKFSSSSEKAFVNGTVKVSLVVNKRGLPEDIKVISGLNDEEDQSAIEAVKQWRFTPGAKQGEPVCVRVSAVIAFHLL